MKDKLLELADKCPDNVFWREFRRVMVSDATSEEIFEKMRAIYAQVSNVADAKKKLRELAGQVQ